MYVNILQYKCKCIIKEYLIQVERGHFREDGVMEDFCDGPHYQQHPLFCMDHRNLQVELYYDDVEFCNPLGSYRKKHKLGKS